MIDTQGNYFFQICAMDVHIGKEIEEISRKNGVSAAQLAELIHTGRRNVYQIFEKDDIYISQLWKISQALGYNFFELFHPVLSKQAEETFNDDHTPYGRTVKFNFEVEYPLAKAKDLGMFIMHVNAIADKMGFKIV